MLIGGRARPLLNLREAIALDNTNTASNLSSIEFVARNARRSLADDVLSIERTRAACLVTRDERPSIFSAISLSSGTGADCITARVNDASAVGIRTSLNIRPTKVDAHPEISAKLPRQQHRAEPPGFRASPATGERRVVITSATNVKRLDVSRTKFHDIDLQRFSHAKQNADEPISLNCVRPSLAPRPNLIHIPLTRASFLVRHDVPSSPRMLTDCVYVEKRHHVQT